MWACGVVSLGINWVIWAWKGINSKEKHLSLIPLTTFWMVWKERNRRAFEGKVEGFDRVKNSWFQTLSLLIKGHTIYLF